MDLSNITNFDKNAIDDVNIYKLIEFIINFLKDYEGGECDNVLIGFLSIIRIFVLENEKLIEFVIKNHILLDILMTICRFSKCQCKF